jgi:hypothetical protein
MTDIGPAPTFTDTTGKRQTAQGVFGYVRTEESEAVKEGRGFVASTAVLPIEIGQILAFVLVNPADSGVKLLITNRRFTSDQANGDIPIEYRAYSNPTYVPGTAGVVVNRSVGSPASDATFRYATGASETITMGGTAGSAETIRTGGGASERQLLVVIPPGNSLGFTVTGAGQNLSQATRVSGTIEWYEEPM